MIIKLDLSLKSSKMCPTSSYNFDIGCDFVIFADVEDCAFQLSGRFLTSHGYGAPELELGSYTCSSDVYSFGVVMLELLTGRKSYDRLLVP